MVIGSNWPNAAPSAGTRSGSLSNFAPDRLAWLAKRAARAGTALDFPDFGHPAMVEAAMNMSLPVLLYRSNAVFWLICQFDKPNGSARSLGPSSYSFPGDGVMLGTAWIDRPVDTRGCTPASTSLPCSMEV
jgi:hypothetical protein